MVRMLAVLLSLAAWTAAPSGGGAPLCAPALADELASTGTAKQLVTACATRTTVSLRRLGIFLHVSRGRPTLGCVSLPLPQLVTVLHWLQPSSAPEIVIGTRVMMHGF